MVCVRLTVAGKRLRGPEDEGALLCDPAGKAESSQRWQRCRTRMLVGGSVRSRRRHTRKLSIRRTQALQTKDSPSLARSSPFHSASTPTPPQLSTAIARVQRRDVHVIRASSSRFVYPSQLESGYTRTVTFVQSSTDVTCCTTLPVLVHSFLRRSWTKRPHMCE